MLECLPVCLVVGSVLGFMSGLGIGGGTLLILWLTVVLDVDPSTARIINLLFFIPSALIACLFRWKKGHLNAKTLIPAIIAGCIGAGIFSCFSDAINVNVLKKIFGLILIAAGMRELFYCQKHQKH